jgi:chromate transporter
MGSLPQIRQDLVVSYRVLSDEELSHAVLIGRSTPGPLGAYIVAVGYRVAAWPGAVAAWLALVTPAFAAIPLLVLIRRYLHLSRMRSAVDALVIGGATLLIPAAFQIARDALLQLAALGAF